MRRVLSLLLILLLAGCSLPVGAAYRTDAPVLPPSPTPDPRFGVHFHPDEPLYVSDQVSFEVVTPTGFDTRDKEIEVRLGDEVIGRAGFGPYGIAGRQQATLWWVWDTSNLQPGIQHLTFSVNPGGPSWEQSVHLLPREDLPASEQNSHWEALTTECCTINYISGTDAARDIQKLGKTADEVVARISQTMPTANKEKIPVVIMSRTLGHGGFTNDAIYVSYLDRNYAGSTFDMIFNHEAVHWFDSKLGGDLRPTLLMEGLAVYQSGGHFKPEPLIPRASALLNLDWYIPLKTLTDSFYPSQHEVGYLEAGALVQYLVETYGWEAFNSFYRDIHPVPSGSQSDAMDRALQAHFNLTLDQLESDFLDQLKAQPVDLSLIDDVRLSVEYYNTVRRYQQMLDPSAYFQTAWLADATIMRQKHITADYLRHPNGIINQYLENLLVETDVALRSKDYTSTAQKLKAINVMLDILENTK
jgi:hypothetical protein